MNSIYTTLPYIRDAVRRRLGRGVASDGTPPGPVGQPALNQKNPTNSSINMMVHEVVAELNLSCEFAVGSTPLQYSVAAQTVNGPVSIDLTGYPGGINSVMSAWWEDSNSNVTPLAYTSSYDLGRDFSMYPSVEPSTPLQIFVEGYRAWLLPAPDTAGTLFMRVGVGLLAPQNDWEPISQLSNDEAAGLATIVAAELAATEIDDQVMESRLKWLAPKSQEWKSRIATSVGRRNGSYVPGIALRSSRVFSGYRTR